MITSNTMFVGSDVTFNVTLKMDGSDVTTGVSFLVSHKNAFTGKNYRQPLIGTYMDSKWVVPFPATVQKDYGKYTLHCTIVDVPMEGYTQQVTFDNAVELTAGGAVQTIDLNHVGVSSTSGETSVASGFVRYDQSQSISDGGKTQACVNIGAHRVEGGTNITVTPSNDGVTQTISLNAGAVVDTTTDQTVGGVKTFSSSPKVPTPNGESDLLAAANKEYVIAHGGDGKQDALSSTQLEACNSGIDSTKRSGYDTHVNTSTGTGADIHVTAQQKTAWTNKQSALSEAQLAATNSGATADKVSSYDTHVANTTVHVGAGDRTSWNTKYTKPGTGIPKTDLASDVQTSLGKADSALQEHQSLTAYRTASAQDAIHDATKQDKLSEAQLAACNSGATVDKVSGYDTHVANTVVHVTASDKSTWSGKQNALSDSQLAAANSGITSSKVVTYDGYATGKQDVISDLNTIRTGASLGATALQSVPNTYRTSAAQDTIDATKQDVVTDLATIRSGATAGSTAVQSGASTTFTGTNTFQGSTAFTGKVSVPTPSGTAQEQASQAFNLGYWQGTILPTIPTLTGTNSWSGTNAFSGPTVFTGTGANRTKISYIDVNGGTSHAATGGMLYNVSCNTPTQSTHVVNKTYVDSTSTLTSAQLTYVQGSSPAEWRVDLPAERLLTECHVKVYIPDVGEVMGQQSYWANLAIIELIEGGESIEGPLYQFNFGTTTSQRTLAPNDTDTLYMHVHSYQSGSGLEAYEMSNAQYLFKNYDSSAESSTLTVTYDLGSLLRNQLRVRFRTNNTTLCNPDPESSTPFDPPRIFYRYHSL